MPQPPTNHPIDDIKDVTSNWCNWVRCAGLTEGRLSSFNVVSWRGIYGWIPSLKLTARTWKWMVGIQSFPFGMAYFQGRTVSFRECNISAVLFYFLLKAWWFMMIVLFNLFLDDRMINGNVPQPCLFFVYSRRVWKTKQPHHDMNVTLPVSHSNQVLNIETTKIQGSLCNFLEPGGFNRVSTMTYVLNF